MESLANFLDGDIELSIGSKDKIQVLYEKVQENRKTGKGRSPGGRYLKDAEKNRSMTLDILPHSSSIDLNVRGGEIPAQSPPFFISLHSKSGGLWFLKAEKFIAICEQNGNCEYFDTLNCMIIEQKVFQTRERKFTIKSDKELVLDIVFGSRKKISALRAFLTCAKAASSIPPFGPTTQKFYETVLMNSDFFCCWGCLSIDVRESIPWDSYFYGGLPHLESVLEFAFDRTRLLNDKQRVRRDSFGYFLAKRMFNEIDTTWKKFQAAISRAKERVQFFEENFGPDKCDPITRLLIHMCHKNTSFDNVCELLQYVLEETEPNVQISALFKEPNNNIKACVEKFRKFPTGLPEPVLTVFGFQSWFSLPRNITEILSEYIDEFYKAMVVYYTK